MVKSAAFQQDIHIEHLVFAELHPLNKLEVVFLDELCLVDFVPSPKILFTGIFLSKM